ncbi:MAG: PRC-barrel domain-containing protein [Xanthobacteraceae bacterium]|nr:PRC-barrel domain-containing protein [Xanthobacteraceae bacterium]
MVIDSSQAQGILGTQVRSSAGEDMGRIVDVVVDKQAQVRGVVIDFGGFLGVGNRQIAVAWSAIRFSLQDKSETLVVDFTRDQLRAAPAYKAGEQIVLLGPPKNKASTTNATNGMAGDAPEKKAPAQ